MADFTQGSSTGQAYGLYGPNCRLGSMGIRHTPATPPVTWILPPPTDVRDGTNATLRPMNNHLPEANFTHREPQRTHLTRSTRLCNALTRQRTNANLQHLLFYTYGHLLCCC